MSVSKRMQNSGHSTVIKKNRVTYAYIPLYNTRFTMFNVTVQIRKRNFSDTVDGNKMVRPQLSELSYFKNFNIMERQALTVTMKVTWLTHHSCRFCIIQ